MWNVKAKAGCVPSRQQAWRLCRMRACSRLTIGMAALWLTALGGFAMSAQDAGESKYAVKVPGGLVINAYRAGIPANGKPVPDGARMARVHWKPKPNQFFPDATVPGELVNVDFMVKDAKRFADSGGWGYAVFDYNAASDTFTPGTTAGTPPQGNDAKCGAACHTAAKARDYVFTEYGMR